MTRTIKKEITWRTQRHGCCTGTAEVPELRRRDVREAGTGRHNPSKCQHCDAPGSVKLLTNVTASNIAFRWFCANCERAWSASAANN
jgi:hypothetical protein